MLGKKEVFNWTCLSMQCSMSPSFNKLCHHLMLEALFSTISSLENLQAVTIIDIKEIHNRCHLLLSLRIWLRNFA
jgi:hypothetical protein